MSLYEEFIVCTSSTECQAVQLNITSNVCVENTNEDKESMESHQDVESSTGYDMVVGSRPSPAHCRCRFCVYASTNSDVISPGSSQKTNGGTTVSQVVGISCGVGCSVDDEDLGNLRSSVGHSTSLPFSRQATLRQEITCSDLRLSEIPGECDELYAGPVKGSEAPCPVSVEFEGIYLQLSFKSMLIFRCPQLHVYNCCVSLELILKMQVS